MADEAFALSPISARPVMPSDADYDAIREAFMETSRGRWFLSEYAKRNRNADTRMVLDAVARIEQTIAAQKQAGGEIGAESLAAIRAIVGEAQAIVAKAVAVLDDSVTLSAAFKAARIIHEVASTLRECGADTRICDLLDQQVAAIDSGHRLLAAVDRDAIDLAFERMLSRVGELSGGAAQRADAASAADQTVARAPAAGEEAMATEAAQAAAEPQPTGEMVERASAAPAETVAAEAGVAEQAAAVAMPASAANDLEFVEPSAAAEDESNLVAAAPAMAADAPAELAFAEPGPAEVAAPQPDGDAELLLEEVVAAEAEIDQDEALLDLVAHEMSAPDVSAPYQPALHAAASNDSSAYQPPAWEEPVPVELSTAAATVASEIAAIQQAVSQESELESVAVAALDEAALLEASDGSTAGFDLPYDGEQLVAPDEAALQPMAVAPPVFTATGDSPDEPGPQPSLGEALLASGVVANPAVVRADVLAPIRRMTQAEKIAFFS